ncbi:MAG: Hsp33 family molecular chaperone HslO [Myxococcales bacterium]|jgi:molecular chaperone Hsp33
MTESPRSDTVLRAMTDDGAFRVVVARSTDTVQKTLETQDAWGDNGRRLGELITGALLVRETMAPKHRVQAIFQSRDKRGRLVADARPDGTNRGLLTRAGGLRTIDLEGGALEMMRTLWMGELHRGVVEVPPGGGMSQALMAYMASSEQVASMIAVSCVLEGQTVKAAGGYIVQLLPEVGRGPLAIMTERLRDFENIDALITSTDAAPAPLLDELLYGMPFTRLDESEVRYECQCSAVRVMGALASLGRAELQELVDAQEVIEMGCDYCGTQYAVPPQQLKGLLEQS